MEALLSLLYGASEDFVMHQIRIIIGTEPEHKTKTWKRRDPENSEPNSKEAAASVRELSQVYELILAADYYDFPAMKDFACKRAVLLLEDCWNSPHIFSFVEKFLESCGQACRAFKRHLLTGLADRVDIFGQDKLFEQLLADCPALSSDLFAQILARPTAPKEAHTLRYCCHPTCRRNTWFPAVQAARSQTCDSCKTRQRTPRDARHYPLWDERCCL